MLELPLNSPLKQSTSPNVNPSGRSSFQAMPQLPENLPADQSKKEQRASFRSSLGQQRGSLDSAGERSNVARLEGTSKVEQEMWKLLNGAGSELAALYAKHAEDNDRHIDHLQRTNLALKEEIGRLRAAAAVSDFKPLDYKPLPPPENRVSLLQVDDAPPLEFQQQPSAVSERRVSFIEAARRFSADVRSSFQAGLGFLGRRVSFAPNAVLPEPESQRQDDPEEEVPGRRRSTANEKRLKERIEAIRRAASTTSLQESSDGGFSDSEEEEDEQDEESEMGGHNSSMTSTDIEARREDTKAEAPKLKKVMRFAESVHSNGSTSSEFHNNFELLPTWQDEVELRAVSRLKSQSHFADDDEDSDDEVQSKPLPGEKWLQKFVIHPNSIWMLVWETLGYLLIFYDSIFLPLQFSDINLEHTVFTIIGWIIRLYWTIHIPMSMLMSYEQINGRVQTRVRKIITVYLRGRFAWDVLLAVFDWLAIFMDNEKMGLLKWLRITRLARIVQARTMPALLKRMLEGGAGAGHGATLLAIIKDVFLLVWSTHLGACLWYGIGISGQSNNTWIALAERLGFNVGTPEFIYAHAFRWQLANFVGESGLHPETMPEYCFLIFTSICGFVATCICVSSMTSAMTRLDITLAQDARNFSLLRQYLTDHKISSKVATRVVQNAQYHVLLQKRRTPEDQIELLSLVSQPLKIELHFEINMKILASHPLFHVYSILNEQAMRQVCHTSVSRLDIAKGDILFHAEELSSPPVMYFVNSGKITYTHHSGSTRVLTERQWACEPVLWTLWMHRGTARAKSECTLSLLNLNSLQDAAKSDISGNKFFIFKYAEFFIEHLNESPPHTLTDLDSEDVDTAWFVQKAVPEDLPKEKRKQILNQILGPGAGDADRVSTMIKFVPFFRNESQYSTGTTRFSVSTNFSMGGNVFGGRGSTRSGRGSMFGLRSSDGQKLQLAANIVDMAGSSRRTRIAGAEFLGTEERTSRTSLPESVISGASSMEDHGEHPERTSWISCRSSQDSVGLAPLRPKDEVIQHDVD